MLFRESVSIYVTAFRAKTANLSEVLATPTKLIANPDYLYSGESMGLVKKKKKKNKTY